MTEPIFMICLIMIKNTISFGNTGKNFSINIMEKNNLIHLIETGRQVGVSRIIECVNSNIAYTYAIQKKKGKYIVFIDEYDLDNCYSYENHPSEKIYVYDNLEDFMQTFDSKYGVTFEDFSISKGQKFFNVELYL